MEEYRNILIKDSEFYNSNSSYVRLLNNKNIKTVGELLDASLDVNFVKGYSYFTCNQVTCLIAALKHKYLGEPLYIDSYLDKHINFDGYYGNGIVFANPDNKLDTIEFGKLFGCPVSQAKPIFNNFKNFVDNPNFYTNKLPERMKLIDFIKWVSQENGKIVNSLKPFANLYIESYKEKQKRRSDIQSLEYLKGRLFSLYKLREGIDVEIAAIEKQIELLISSDEIVSRKR